ncbi:MAG: YebG family protein [Kangiellaceae bacterium]|jgi:dsDNA-binding SOS-regulon protein|nr:YebG family protein [Kangiellaceae bacterium]
MAVVTLFMSDRDKSKTFTDKKEADQYDKMLELAENVSAWMEQSIDGLTEEQSEAIGMLIARNKDLVAKAVKGKPEALLEDQASEDEGQQAQAADDNVTPLAANE